MGASGQLLHAILGRRSSLFLSGLAVDDNMRILNEGKGTPVCPSLYMTGGNLAGATRWREKSGEGVALASAHDRRLDRGETKDPGNMSALMGPERGGRGRLRPER